MSLIRTSPWAMHQDFFNELNQRLFRGAADASSGATADWIPSVDILEYDDRFVLHADVPGVNPDSIEITLEKGVLSVTGERNSVSAEGAERRRAERASGRFYRRFALPDTVDADSVTASNRNGVLEITIPKRPQSQPRRITVTH